MSGSGGYKTFLEPKTVEDDDLNYCFLRYYVDFLRMLREVALGFK